MELDKDFKEFIELLSTHKVEYLVIGGYAVNFHGYPRYTKDIDFWIWMTKENSEKIMTVLKEFGFGSLGLKSEDFLVSENIIQLGYEPYRIDIIMNVDGLEFETSYQNRSSEKIGDTFIDFLSIDDLILAKRYSGRLQDLADAEQLEKIKKRKKDET